MTILGNKVWTLHSTDLFRPHEDPDDHWDLACQFALARNGKIDLRGIVIDYPCTGMGDPDICAVSQMGVLTGIVVPVGVGDDIAKSEVGSGQRLLEQVLEEAPEPVTLHIVGSCRDVARCSRRCSKLFTEKVRAVYLNAGSGVDSDCLEYNVSLDPQSYAQIFKLPCPVYWLPCFHDARDLFTIGKYGSFYRFRQGKVFQGMPKEYLSYFLNMFARKRDSDWLSALKVPVDTQLLKRCMDMERSMWSTGALLHAVNLTVHVNGTIAPLGVEPAKEVFEFVPISVKCDDEGHVQWRTTTEKCDRFIFRVRDIVHYQEAMGIALGELIACLWNEVVF